MLSGRRAFNGQNSVSIMAAILHKDAEPLDATAEINRLPTGQYGRSNLARAFRDIMIRVGANGADGEIVRQRGETSNLRYQPWPNYD
jgi:hypothetical protein